MLRDRKLIRLLNHDYSSAGTYFVTICCRKRIKYFGEINDGKMVLSEIGLMATEFLTKIPEHFKNVLLDEFVVMPDHIHGIMIITAGTCHGMSLQPKQKNRFSFPVKNSLSVIINQYKSTLKRWCNRNGFEYFSWQPRFHERILHTRDSIERTRAYIISNPQNYYHD